MSANKRQKRAKLAGRATLFYTADAPGLLVDGKENTFREFISNFFAAASVMQQLRRLHGQTVGRSATEYAILLAVSRMEGKPNIREIADHLQISASNVTADVNRLVDAGVLLKEIHPADMRAVAINLTAKGRKMLEEILPIARRANNQLFGHLTRDQMVLLNATMKHIIDEGGYLLHAPKRRK